jgi:hypothetical protein
MITDSTRHPIKVGDKVRFRGEVYTIKAFRPGEGEFGTAVIEFEEEQHTPEVADEIKVDLVEAS